MLTEEDIKKDAIMNYNVCSCCGASGGKAGNLFTVPGHYEDLCRNCRDTLLTQVCTEHTDLPRTDEELAKMVRKLLRGIDD